MEDLAATLTKAAENDVRESYRVRRERAMAGYNKIAAKMASNYGSRLTRWGSI